MLWGITPPSPAPRGCLGSSCLGIASESFGLLGSQSWEGGRDPLSISQTNQGGRTSLPRAFTAPCPSEPGHGPALPSARSDSEPHACPHPLGLPLFPASPSPSLRGNPALFPRGLPILPPQAQAPARGCSALP